jgi:hypothetical protein
LTSYVSFDTTGIALVWVRVFFMKKEPKESFVLFKSFYEPIKNLTLEQKGKLLDAIFNYQIDNREPCIKEDAFVYSMFLFFKNQFRLDDIKYQAKCEKNKLNGSKGGRPKDDTAEDNPKNPIRIMVMIMEMIL